MSGYREPHMYENGWFKIKYKWYNNITKVHQIMSEGERLIITVKFWKLIHI